jgi:hypothetical protein
MICGLGGHTLWLKAQHDRIFLECATCGHQTPGWHIDVRMQRMARPRRRFGASPAARTIGRDASRRCA